MKYRKLDQNGDMSFGNAILDFYVDIPEAVAQAVLTRLKLWQGEWFIDTEAGVPYNTRVIGFGNTFIYDYVLKSTILQTKGVNSIKEYSSFIDQNRNAKVSVVIDTIYGLFSINNFTENNDAKYSGDNLEHWNIGYWDAINRRWN
jgi:hypothetical protein